MLTKDRLINIAVGVLGLAGGLALYLLLGDLPVDPATLKP